MEDEGERRIRPALWVIVGALAVPVGLLMALDAAATATRVGGVEGAPRCATEFAKGCTIQRAAVLDHQGHTRGDWMTREQRWLARVPNGAPGLQGAELLDVTVPRQDGRVGLVEGAEVTVVYFGRSPAWIQLPSGAVLETEDHPRRKAPLLAWLALGAVGGGLFGMRTGIRAGRHGGGWLRRTPARVRGGLDVVLLVAGMLGAIVHQFAGGAVWAGIVAGLLAAGFGVLLWRSPPSGRACLSVAVYRPVRLHPPGNAGACKSAPSGAPTSRWVPLLPGALICLDSLNQPKV